MNQPIKWGVSHDMTDNTPKGNQRSTAYGPSTACGPRAACGPPAASALHQGTHV